MVLLDAYAAKRCARRVHNEWAETIETVEWGREFETDVLITAPAWPGWRDPPSRATVVQ